ncbi:hypothetical protein [Myxosarcina sp. GI1]|uniref:DUF6940 family protein n=1 Tax=Myxosarcina sp. GI1 TaxID=1541065 RepID=UPI0005601DF8|nr:hypothetical protein [Myxosarcina sp. GI1]
MWKFHGELLKGDRFHKISIFADDKQLAYSEVIELWQNNSSFRDFFSSLLANAPFAAYFWETLPVTKSTVERKFEFVLANSPQLAQINPDPSDFERYFSSAEKEIVTFPNLGNDALLIVPLPIADRSAYPHLAAFIREAPKSQQHLLWQTIGKELKQKLNQQPVWVSTSGLGVSWLHVRLDSSPKYYCFEPYKSAIYF